MPKQNKWIQALKIWNKKNPKWIVPKKGTAAHKEVKKIQQSL